MKFVDKKPNKLVIDLPIDYYGQAETIGITQYVTEQAKKYFDNIDSYEIRIKDGNNSRALISKTKDDKDPQVHIYSINQRGCDTSSASLIFNKLIYFSRTMVLT